MADWVLAILVMLIGLALLVVGFISRQKAKRTEAWPITPGTVLHSEVKKHTSYNSKTHRSNHSYEPIVNYQYSVMGQTYTGSRIGFGTQRMSFEKASKIESMYATGGQVSVRYNPDEVGEATLETTAFGSLRNLILGGAIFVAGVALLIIFLS